ncbi:uncharacterized protein LOC143280573 [Babylonia areolata]|uniref:uncharacterized protein LOC143280573 n=1 Tax=Babylonia areolata TaxID=304850 RepID=UPI003FD63039
MVYLEDLLGNRIDTDEMTSRVLLWDCGYAVRKQHNHSVDTIRRRRLSECVNTSEVTACPVCKTVLTKDELTVINLPTYFDRKCFNCLFRQTLKDEAEGWKRTGKRTRACICGASLFCMCGARFSPRTSEADPLLTSVVEEYTPSPWSARFDPNKCLKQLDYSVCCIQENCNKCSSKEASVARDEDKVKLTQRRPTALMDHMDYCAGVDSDACYSAQGSPASDSGTVPPDAKILEDSSSGYDTNSSSNPSSPDTLDKDQVISMPPATSAGRKRKAVPDSDPSESGIIMTAPANKKMKAVVVAGAHNRATTPLPGSSKKVTIPVAGCSKMAAVSGPQPSSNGASKGSGRKTKPKMASTAGCSKAAAHSSKRKGKGAPESAEELARRLEKNKQKAIKEKERRHKSRQLVEEVRHLLTSVAPSELGPKASQQRVLDTLIRVLMATSDQCQKNKTSLDQCRAKKRMLTEKLSKEGS